MWTTEQIVQASGCTVRHVAGHWPLIAAALRNAGMSDPLIDAAAIATVTVECNFRPITEQGPLTYFNKYEPGTSIGKRLGNTQVGDGFKYRGRGFVQLTGRENFRTYGKLLNLSLEANPDLALMPQVAARLLAAYFKRARVHEAALQHNWPLTRRRVNGGYHGWARYRRTLLALMPTEVIPEDPAGG